MKGFNWLIFCMVILNSGPDDMMMSVSGLDCFVCFYIKKNNATKQACINSILNFTLPCNNLEDFEAGFSALKMREEAEMAKFRPEFLDKRNGLSLRAGNRVGGRNTNGHKYFCAVATTALPASEITDLKGVGAGDTVTVVNHGCLETTSDDAKSMIMDKCDVDRINERRSDFYACNSGLMDGKPCNFDDKCKVTRPRRRTTNVGTPKLIMPVTIGLYILIGNVAIPTL